jgi:hypothetical protein
MMSQERSIDGLMSSHVASNYLGSLPYRAYKEHMRLSGLRRAMVLFFVKSRSDMTLECKLCIALRIILRLIMWSALVVGGRTTCTFVHVWVLAIQTK